MAESINRYDATYSRFFSQHSIAIRREVYGEDIGQNSWLTADEQRDFAGKAGFGHGTRLLELGCGSGGPALFLARSFGVSVTGLDINEAGIAAANAAAAESGLAGLARFVRIDGGAMLPFPDGSFEAVQSIDTMNHMPDRQGLLSELYRLLRPGGTLLYTDPVVVTGAVSNEEIAARAAIGFYVFMPPGENERMLQRAGFDIVAAEDATANAAMIAARWIAAREAWRQELVAAEGLETYERSLRFSRAVHALSDSRRLSRIMFLARRPDGA